jgi:hypothetical protein
MTGSRRHLRVIAVIGLIAASGRSFDSAAQGQGAVAFQPSIGFVPSGSTLTVTPAVSADRRYVRLGVNAYFNTFNGFTPFAIPLAAVGGGGNFAGMNGVMGGGGVGGGIGGGMGSGAPGGQGGPVFDGPYGAGGFPYPPGTGFGDAGLSAFGGGRSPVVARAPIPWPDGPGVRAEPWPQDPPMFSGADDGPTVRAARPVRGQRQAARKPPRRASSAARRREAAKRSGAVAGSGQQP